MSLYFSFISKYFNIIGLNLDLSTLDDEDFEDDQFAIVEIHNVLDDREKKRYFSKCFIHYLIGNISADGNVYPCNYHPKPNGYNFGSAITDRFDNIWESLMSKEIDKQISTIIKQIRI